MSGQATGWVLREGPRPDDLDRNGKKYGQRARGLRAVLVTVADAANRDGEHAHPGQQAMVDGSLYSRGQVVAIVGELVAEGWLRVEAQGGGRGKATVYAVNMGRRETARSSDGSSAEPRGGAEETARPEALNRADAPPLTCDDATPNGATELLNVETPAVGGALVLQMAGGSPPEQTNGQRASAILGAYMDWCDKEKRPRPARAGQAAQAIRLVLDAGWSERQVKAALVASPTVTTSALEVALAKGDAKPAGARAPVVQDRNRPSGEVAL